jgi:HEAT repeat protein
MRFCLPLLIIAGSVAVAADEPTFNGMTAAEYMSMAKNDPLPRKRKAAVLALGQLITDQQSSKDTILPVVVKVLRSDSTSSVREQAARVLTQQSAETLAGYMTDFSESLRQEKDSAVKREIANAIGRIGRAAQSGVLPLIDALGDSVPATRAAAAMALGRIGPGANGAADRLLKLIRDPDASVRYGAVFALGRIDPADPDAAATGIIAVLATERAVHERMMLQSTVVGPAASALRNGEMIAAGVVSLGLLGVRTAPTVAAITANLADPDAETRQQAAFALAKLTVAAVSSLDALFAVAADDSDRDARIAAVQAIGAISSTDPARMITFFGEQLKREKEFEVRIAMVDELGALGAAGNAAIGTLRDAQRDPQVKVREAAAAAIKRITKPVVPMPDKP